MRIIVRQFIQPQGLHDNFTRRKPCRGINHIEIKDMLVSHYIFFIDQETGPSCKVSPLSSVVLISEHHLQDTVRRILCRCCHCGAGFIAFGCLHG